MTNVKQVPLDVSKPCRSKKGPVTFLHKLANGKLVFATAKGAMVVDQVGNTSRGQAIFQGEWQRARPQRKEGKLRRLHEGQTVIVWRPIAEESPYVVGTITGFGAKATVNYSPVDKRTPLRNKTGGKILTAATFQVFTDVETLETKLKAMAASFAKAKREFFQIEGDGEGVRRSKYQTREEHA